MGPFGPGGPGLTRRVATRIGAGETRGCPTFRGLKRGAFGPAVQFPEVNDWAGVPPWRQDGFAGATSFGVRKVGPFGPGGPGLTRRVATRIGAGETGGCPTFRGLKPGAFGPAVQFPEVNDWAGVPPRRQDGFAGATSFGVRKVGPFGPAVQFVQFLPVNARNRLPEAAYLFRKNKRNCSTPNLLGPSPVPESPDCGACTPVSRAFSWRSRR